jgi:pentose-5-phosphate-3-epimerase
MPNLRSGSWCAAAHHVPIDVHLWSKPVDRSPDFAKAGASIIIHPEPTEHVDRTIGHPRQRSEGRSCVQPAFSIG